MSDLLPPTAAPQERAFSEAVARLGEVPIPSLDPETCPAALLPWLAWAESIDAWDASWTEAQKRAAIVASRAVHEHKGTAGAMAAALGAVNFDAQVREWFAQEPPGDPYTFVLEVTADQLPIASAADLDRLAAIATSAKNLRSHMIGVDIRAVSRGALYVAAAACIADIITIGPEPGA